MNREVEERIVAMYFDNQDFEKNAKTTIETLGQLKDGLNLEDTAQKGFSVFEKIGKTLDFTKANQGLQKMKTTMSSMGNIFKKIFNLGPIDDAFRALDNFKNKYFDRVIGFDIANKLVSSMESIFRQLTVQPVSAGWEQYQAKMDSVKTIMTSTGESIDVVNAKLADMTQYANKTIYSLTDMTSNLGKFTNNGVKLDDAVQAMEGIANATAHAGQGSQAASMAMYNISQAMGVGKMTTVDWKSLENANVATMQLKNTFLEVAAAAGKIKKEVVKAGDTTRTVFKLTTDENGKKLKQEIELTAENFREYLSKGWLDKETMLRTFQIYSGEGIDENTLKSWGITDPELIKQMYELGEEAMEAATQVRTASKMLDALKESVQSGWADSFEIIFGNMEEGMQLWTKMNEKIDSVLSASTERRNKMLKSWAEMTENGLSYWTKDDNGNDVRTGIKGGREILMDTFFELMSVAKTVGDMISDAFSKVFGKLDAKKLFNLTLGFRDLVEKMKTWLGTTKDANSRISKLQKGLQGVFSVIKVGINAVKAIFNLVKKLASPVLDFAINAFAEFGKFFDGLADMSPAMALQRVGRQLKQIWENIKSFFTVKAGETESPFSAWVKNAWNTLKTTVKTWANNLGLGGVVDAIETAWNAVSTWPGWTDIGNFFTDTWNWICGVGKDVIAWFQPQEDGTDSGFVKFIKDIAAEISRIWNIVANWDGWKAIGKFFGDIWAWIADKANVVINWFAAPEDGTDSGFVKFIKDTVAEISRIWNIVANWEGWSAIGKFFGDIWGWIADKSNVVVQWFTYSEDGKDSGFTKFINDVASEVSRIWGVVTAWDGWKAIGKFFGDIWGWIADKANVVITWFTFSENGEDSGFVKFLKDVKSGVEGAWKEIATWDGWEEIGNFFSDIWSWIMNLFAGGEETEDDSAASSAHRGIERKAGTLKKLRDSAREHLQQIKGLADDLDENSTDAGAMQQKASVFRTIITTITDFIERTVSAIRGWVIPKEVDTFLTGFGNFISGLLDALGVFLGSLGNILKGQGSFEEFARVIGVSIIPAVFEILDLLKTKWLSGISATSMAQQFLEIAGGLFLMASGVAILTTLDEEKLWPAVGVIAALGVIVGFITGTLSKIAKAKAATTTPLTGGQQILTTLINTIGKIGTIATALALLPGIIETIGKVKKDIGNIDIGGDLLNILLGMTALISGVSIALAATQAIAGKSGIDPIGAVKTTIAVIAAISIAIGAMAGIVALTNALVGNNTEKVVEDINNAALVLGAVGGAIGSFFAAMFGGGTGEQKVEGARRTAEELEEMSKVFDEEKVTGINRMIRLMESVTETAAKASPVDLANFGYMMGSFGEGIYNIASKLSEVNGPLAEIGDDTSEMYRRLTNFMKIAGMIGNMANEFGSAGFNPEKFVSNLEYLAKGPSDIDSTFTYGAEGSNLERWVDSICRIMERLGQEEWTKDSGIQFDGLNIASKLVQSIQDGLIDPKLPKFDATPITTAILDALKLEDTAIAEVVHNMVQNGLILSGDKNGAGEYTIDKSGMEFLSEWAKNGGSTEGLFDVSSLTEVLTGKDGKGGILGELNGLSDKIPSLSSMFADKGWMDFKDENGNDIDILSELQGHLTELGTTLETMEPLQVTITPVIDFSQITPERLQEQLNDKPLELNSIFNLPSEGLKIDFTGLSSELDMATVIQRLQDIILQIASSADGIRYNIDDLGSHMDGIASEISRMEMILDTGALVGQLTPLIDKKLANLELVNSRQ